MSIIKKLLENLKKYIITDEFEEKRAESLKAVETE